MSLSLSNITNDSYHWIVWADGYGNITESDELNNNMASPDKMVIGDDCIDLLGGVQNDAGLGSDAGNDPANATNMGSNITGTTPDVWMVQTEMMSMHLTSLQVISWK